jgi:Conjugative transposon protein TcpC
VSEPEPSRAATVSLRATPLWRIRLLQDLPRWLLRAAAAAGLIASARFAIAPPRPQLSARPDAGVRPLDPEAEGFASLFARAYLTWQQGDPEARRKALEALGGSGLALEAGAQPPPQGSQQVLFEQVVQEREPQADLHVYSIAVETEPQGLLYLTVPVLHRPGGDLSIAGYPAFVGPPISAPAQPLLQSGAEVQEVALRTVVERALRNYLAPAPSDLAADLAPGARVSPPPQGLALESLQSLSWALAASNVVVAQVAVTGPAGARYTLAYELQVRDVAGRWEVAAIQMEAT